MPSVSSLKTSRKVYACPRRPFEKERLDSELKIVGEYGLCNKKELWRVHFTLAKIRRAARYLLTLEEKDPRRILEGSALLRRLFRAGLLPEEKLRLDYALALTETDLLNRRLQTIVWKRGLAKSIHHARVLIRHRHIAVSGRIVNIPSFCVRVESEQHISNAVQSPWGMGRPGRTKRIKMRNAKESHSDSEAEE